MRGPVADLPVAAPRDELDVAVVLGEVLRRSDAVTELGPAQPQRRAIRADLARTTQPLGRVPRVRLDDHRAVSSGTGTVEDCHDLAGRLLLVRVALVDRKSTRLNSSHVKISYAVF